MGTRPIIPVEATYEEWVIADIKRYFKSIFPNIDILSFSLGSRKEAQFPADRVLAVGNKVIGIQFKRPSMTTEGIQWKLDMDQYKRIQGKPWMYYCLPNFIDERLREVALHHCWFLPGDMKIKVGKWLKYQSKYLIWGVIGEGIIICYQGVEISREERTGLHNWIMENPRNAYITLGKKYRELFILRSKSDYDEDYQD